MMKLVNMRVLKTLAVRLPGASPGGDTIHAYPVETHSRKNLLDVEVMYETRLG